MIPLTITLAAVGKLKNRATELTDIAWRCRVVKKHKLPKDHDYGDLCPACTKKAKLVLEQTKDDMIAEGMKLLSKLGSTGAR